MEYMEDPDEPQFPGHGRYLMGAPPPLPPEKIVGTLNWSAAATDRFCATVRDYNASHADEVALRMQIREAFEAGRSVGFQQAEFEQRYSVGRYRKDS